MSVQGMVDAMRTKGMPPATRLVWICLENHANGARCWSISTAELADELDIHPDTVQRAVIDLETRGIIRREAHRRRPTTFHMMRAYPAKCAKNDIEQPAKHAKLAELSIVDDHHPQPLNPEISDSTLVEGESLNPGIPVSTPELTLKKPDSSPELSLIFPDSLIHQKNPPERVHQREARVRAPEEVTWIVDAWNAMAARSDLAAVRAVTEKRKARIRERVKQFGRAGVLEAIERIGASAFCTGANDRGWKADFDFLLQESSLGRALEGRYDNRAPALDPNRLTGFARAAYLAKQELAAFDAAEARARQEGSFPMIEDARS